jgi:hypothetical protein
LSRFRDIFLTSDLKNFFSRSPRSREVRETEALIKRARDAFSRSRWASENALPKFMARIVIDACDKFELAPSSPLGDALVLFVSDMAASEPFFDAPPLVSVPDLTLEQAMQLRRNLHRQLQFLSNEVKALELWRELVIEALSSVLDALPSSVFCDYDEAGVLADNAPRMEVALADLLYQPHLAIESALGALFTPTSRTLALFDTTKARLDRNLRIASGIDPDHPEGSTKKVVGPKEQIDEPAQKIVETFCKGTPYFDLFKAPLPFFIPFPCRFEHTHVLGGSGHGKTQLLQYLISHDLAKAKEDNRSIVVIDSQGDLIRAIAGLSCFAPDDPDSLADRLLIVDPTDVEYPACLNMFDWNRGRIDTLRPLDRERMLNGTVDLYEYLFGALLGAELTQRQGVIFKYIARLMMEIPGATIQTLRELMENGEKFRPYMKKLPGSARAFFETRFFDRTFNETKKQILTRLWGVLSNATFERMFSHERNKVDLYDAMSGGKIVLINTAKELLTHDGAAIFGRFFIALISQAALQRSALQPHERNPAFVYVDEAQDYFDDKIGHLLNQARKYRVGMVLAHQNLDQLSAGLRASVMSSTSIKLAGGVSAKDARALAEDMHIDPEFLQKMRKSRERTEFACFVRNFTPQAVQVSVPLGYLERQPRLEAESVATLIDTNRSLYCAPIIEVSRLLAPPEQPKGDESVGVEAAPTQDKSGPKQRPTKMPEIVEPSSTKPSPPRPPPKVDRDAPLDLPSSRQSQARVPAQQSRLPGKGGQRHRYIQQFVKRLGEELGFRAVVEEPILDRTGQVDVALYREDLKIACEISVTTGSDQELRNVEKCIAAGFSKIILVADDARRLASLRKAIAAEIEEQNAARVAYCITADLHALLQEYQPASPPQVVRGYKVRVKKSGADVGNEARRKAVAEVIAKSLTKRVDQ